MGIFITLVSLFVFFLVMSLYKICQRYFLKCSKSKTEEIGFLPDSILAFLEFVTFLLTFLIIESLVLQFENFALTRFVLFITCFIIMVSDDVVLHKKLKKTKSDI